MSDNLQHWADELAALEQLYRSNPAEYFGEASSAYRFGGQGVQRARRLVEAIAKAGPGDNPQRWQDVYRRAGSLPQG